MDIKKVWYDIFKLILGLQFERFETIGEFVEGLSTKQFSITTQKDNSHKPKMPPLSFKACF